MPTMIYGGKKKKGKKGGKKTVTVAHKDKNQPLRAARYESGY